MNLPVAQAQTSRHGVQSCFRTSRPFRIINARQESAVTRQRDSGNDTDRGLERGVTTRILPRVEIREAIQVTIVRSGITQQMSHSEVDTAAAGEQLVFDTDLDRIGIGPDRCVLGRVGDVHLHGAAGTDRIVVLEEPLPERHRADEVFVDVAEVFLRLGRIDAIAVAATRTRGHLQSPVDQQRWHSCVCRA